MNHRPKRRLLVSLACLGTACSHVVLQVPSPDADPRTRQTAYEALRPVERRVLVVTHLAVTVQRETTGVLLGNGQLIEDPVDLLPAVRPTSQTAKDIRAVQAARGPWDLWGGLALGCVAVGVTPFIFEAVSPRILGPSGVLALYSGQALAVVGTITSLIIGAVTAGNPSRAWEGAFRNYDADLREYLGIHAGQP